MKRLLLIISIFLGGCATTTHNIYNMSVGDESIEIVSDDNIEISVQREYNQSKTTLQDTYINYNVWLISATNNNNTCIKVGLIWNLSGFIYKPITIYTNIPKQTTKPLGLLVDEVVDYDDFSYALRGYGRVREIVTKACSI